MANGTTTSDTVPGSLANETTAAGPVSLELPESGFFDDDATLHVAPADGAELVGGDDVDVIIGGDGDDRLDGGEDDDALVGGGGTNIMEGGEGDDVFGHAAGANDIIVDFAPEQDETLTIARGLTLSDSEQGTITANLGNGSAQYDATILTFSDGSTVALLGFTGQTSEDWLLSS